MNVDVHAPRPRHQEDLLLQHLRSYLGIVDEAAIEVVRGRVRWLPLAAGETLMRQGEAGDALYLLVSGRLRVYIERDGQRRAVREISRGEVVGEMSLITQEPRSATLVAIRDSVLVSLGKEDFAHLQAISPAISLALTRKIIERLRTENERPALDRPVTMAVLPVSDGVDALEAATALAAQLSPLGRVAVLDAAEAGRRLGMALRDDDGSRRRVSQLIDETEGTHDFVLLAGGAAPDFWTGCCARHADEILLLADATREPKLHANERALLMEPGTAVEAAQVLLLVHPAGTRMPRDTARWLARRPVTEHMHLRRGHDGDMARLARVQSRTAVGLVLAGGGARGFAHLGIYRALREQGIEVDVVGGTSMGAVMSLLMAADLSHQDAEALARRAFRRNPTGDWSLLPLLSLVKGRRLRRVVADSVAECVGPDAGIEDLWKRYFCIASNFSVPGEVVIERGDLQRALLASIAIPGALPPVVHEGDLLCDGGTFNNFPVDVMRRVRGVGRVIGVDLGAGRPRPVELQELPGPWALLFDRLKPRRARRYRLPGMASVLMNSTILYSLSRRDEAKRLTDLYFNPPLHRVGMLDWKRFDSVVRQGYTHAKEVLGGQGSQQASG